MPEKSKEWLAKEITTLLVLLILFYGFFHLVLPAITGVDSPFTVVISGSMRPTLEEGDLLIVVGVDPYSLKEGDIIVFRAPWAEHPVVHRIVRKDMGPQGPIFYTKGDNNAFPDPGYRTSKDIYGKVIEYSKDRPFRIPFLGAILELIQSVPAKLMIIGLIAAYIIYEYSKMADSLKSEENYAINAGS